MLSFVLPRLSLMIPPLPQGAGGSVRQAGAVFDSDSDSDSDSERKCQCESRSMGGGSAELPGCSPGAAGSCSHRLATVLPGSVRAPPPAAWQTTTLMLVIAGGARAGPARGR